MKSGRIFVTFVMILGISTMLGCDGKRRRAAQNETDRRAAMVKEGNAKITEADQVRTDLASTYGIRISDAKTSAEKFNWKNLSLEQRRDAQGKIARYLELINRILEIDSHKLITVDHRDQIILGRESAEKFQRSLEGFEAANGENIDPKKMPETKPR